jgi:hypothetical protein
MNPRKHFSRWFTTSTMRAINLDRVTEIEIHKVDGSISSAIVYQAGAGLRGKTSLTVSAKDAAKLYNLLES